MASPEPKAPAAEQRPASEATSAEERSEVNGHAAPPKADEEVSPKINGNSTKPNHDGPNGVASPAAEKPSSPSVDPKPTSLQEPRNPSKSEDAPATTEDEVKGAAEGTGSKDSDVEMAGVTKPTDTVEKAATATAKDTAGTSEPPKEEAARETKSPKPQEDSMAVDGPEEAPVPNNDGKDTSPSVAAAPGSSGQEGDAGPSGLSQLAIDDEQQPKTAAPTTTQGDVNMEDAPAPAKVAREREDDAAEEPSAKRAKTEPKEDVVQVSTMPLDAKKSKGLSGIENWNNKSLEAMPITDYRVKEFRHVLSGVKKTKDGKHFKDAVIKTYPHLAISYREKVSEPVDLGELERGLRDHRYKTLGDFKRKLSLLYLNAVAFNGETNPITLAGLNVVENVWTKCLVVPDEEPPKSKTKQMPPRHHEQRAPPPRQPAGSPPAGDRERTGQKPKQPQPHRKVPSAAGSPTDNGNDSQTFAVPPGGVPQIRRASSNMDGDRPKRAIHPPRSKDIDYSSKAAGKRGVKPELQFCNEVLRTVMDPKHFGINSAFLDPVDPVALGIPTYFSVIKKPMDLSTIRRKLDTGGYSIAKQFYADMDLMFNNCFKFNPADTVVHDLGRRLKSLFQSEWNKKDQWLAKHAASKPASVDSEGSEDESEAEVEVAVSGGNTAMLMNTITALQEKLQEETAKLNNLYMEDHPNEALIKLQSTVLSTVQQSLLAEKQKLASLKTEKPAKAKSGKPVKGKSGGGGGAGGRKAGAPGAKKAGGAKKAPKKERVLGPTERNIIAGALSDPAFPSIDNAIYIIKEDTGQLENDSGELELDMEQLSPVAIQKLWDLCSRVIPGFGRGEGNAAGGEEDDSPVAERSGITKQRKKNKPMNAREQEERINRLTRIQEQFRKSERSGQVGSPRAANESINAATSPGVQEESSDESSDSEEE
ncbi:uncharacterized protein DNG_07797 [Cephalotrichum gorgonifer]|uniref:Bromo domain-containing protein n=1 Tax=Cephalotrichum gorgonifer TaxID=2041049 RepID=A0AAE8N5B4_9PEZI|nr:uncharacterized protein DNG_07797 [Cephalotrichum gorgonifer]